MTEINMLKDGQLLHSAENWEIICARNSCEIKENVQRAKHVNL